MDNSAISKSPDTSVGSHYKVRRHIHWRLVGIVAGLLLLGSASVYAFYIWPVQHAGAAFTHRMASFETADFKGQLVFTGDDFLTGLNSNLTFSGQLDKSHAKPLVSTVFQGKLVGKQYDAAARIIDGYLYLKLAGPELPVLRLRQSNFQYQMTPDWHKIALDKTLLDNYCDTPSNATYPNPIDTYRLLRTIKLSTSPLAGRFVTIDGHRTTHFTGRVDAATAVAAANGMAAQLPHGCTIGTIGYSAQAKDLDIRYDVWTADDFNRITITLRDKSVGSQLVLRIDTSNFDKPVTVTTPSTAVDLAAIRAPQMAALDRDHQRRSDIDRLRSALAAYLAATGRYPASLTKLAPTYIISVPLDPATRKPYTYTLSGSSDYTLSANLEEPGAGYQVSP